MVTAYVRQQFDTSVEVAIDNASDMLATCHSLLVSTFKIKKSISPNSLTKWIVLCTLDGSHTSVWRPVDYGPLV